MSDETKGIIGVACDWVTIIAPLIIAIVGTLEASGLVEMLGERGVAVAAGLAALSTAASVLFNIVTGYYKNDDKAAGIDTNYIV